MRTLRVLTAAAAVAAIQLTPVAPASAATAPKELATAALANGAGKPMGAVTRVSEDGTEVRMRRTLARAGAPV